MSDYDEQEEDFQPTPEQIELTQAKADELEAVAKKLGLYQRGYRVGVVRSETGERHMMIVADFTPGDVAWSPRILEPEVHSVEQEFKTIASGLEADEFEEYRRRLAEQLGADDDA